MNARQMLRVAVLVLAGGVLAACTDTQEPVAPAPAVRANVSQPAAPSHLVTVPFGTGQLTLWPYTGDSFSGDSVDPIHVLIPNRTPRDIRAALLLLDGDRTAFQMPNAFPFNCVWQDAADGTNQTAYTQANGWVGSAIQLACGPIGPMRFHVRLFPAGGGTIAGAHFEMQIPGTPDHNAMSWLLARNLVTADLVRTGLLDENVPFFPVPIETATPTYRDLRVPDLYWYLALNPDPGARALAAALQVVVVSPTDVRMGNDGAALEFNFVGNVEGQRLIARHVFEETMDQYLPRPICASGPYDIVHVVGPIIMRQQVVATPSGNYISQFFLDGKLDVTPVDPATKVPIGETFQAVLKLSDRNIVTDQTTLVSYVDVRMGMPASIFKGSAHIRMTVGPGGSSKYTAQLTCD